VNAGTAEPERPQTRRSPAQREQTPEGALVARRLLDAGLGVLGRRGYKATRIDDITDAASVSHGTFYLYFPNKEALVVRLAQECKVELDRVIDALGALGPQPGQQAWLQWLDQFIDVYRRHGPILRIWFEAHDPDLPMHALAEDEFSRLSAGMETLIRGQLPAPADPAVAALAAVGMIERVCYYLTSRPDQFADMDLADTLSQMLSGLVVPSVLIHHNETDGS
jgi:AcrR family transcriptional regulator